MSGEHEDREERRLTGRREVDNDYIRRLKNEAEVEERSREISEDEIKDLESETEED
jgi:hypothetical protein